MTKHVTRVNVMMTAYLVLTDLVMKNKKLIVMKIVLNV